MPEVVDLKAAMEEKQFQIIKSLSLDELSNLVTEKLFQGWKLHGETFTVIRETCTNQHSGETRYIHWYCQPMVKSSEESESL